MAGLGAVAGDFVGLSAEQLARAGRQSDDGAVQVRSVIMLEKSLCYNVSNAEGRHRL